MKYLVVEINDRIIRNTTQCKSINQALSVANTLLKNWTTTINYEEEFMSNEGKGDSWELATKSNMNAWCNFRGETWDAHIIEVE